MLIELSDDLIDVDFSSDIDVVSTVCAALGASRSGTHLVMASRSLLRKLYATAELSLPVRLEAKSVLDRYAELGALAEKIQSRVVISYKSDGVNKIGGDRWILGAKTFAAGALNKTVLIGEDLSDVDILFAAARFYQLDYGFERIAFALQPVGGGGNRTSAQFERYLRERTAGVLCVTDSDRRFEGAPLKETARECERVAGNYSWWAKHIVLDAHEIENLLPLELTKNAALHQRKDEMARNVAGLSKLPISLRRFGDLKSGVKVKDVACEFKSTPMGKYWGEIYDQLKSVGAFNCSCESDVVGECCCELVPKLGSDLAKVVCSFLEDRELDDRVISRCRGDVIYPLWLELGKQIFEWGVSSKMSRV